MMENQIISYLEMCQREGTSLQQGMNYRLGKAYSVILMSLRPNAPYRDTVLSDGTTLIYEGHDASKSLSIKSAKNVDQPQYTTSGKLTQNGKFYSAAKDYKNGLRNAEPVRVYEKLRPGIWANNGLFELIDSWIESDGTRNVFKFKLHAITELLLDRKSHLISGGIFRRIIPTEVKLQVWKRDNGKCVLCGSKNELHFDHIIPFSKGGTSLVAENIQLLCARHNLENTTRLNKRV